MSRVLRFMCLAAIVVCVFVTTPMGTGQDRVYYLYIDNIDTPQETREHLHYVGISNQSVYYSLEERIYGCIKQSTTRTMFQHYCKVTESEQAAILEDLSAAGVFEVKADAEPSDLNKKSLYGYLDAEFKGRSIHIGNFFTPPTDGSRKQVHEYLFRLADRLGLASARPAEHETDVTEGDNVAASEVDLRKLIKDIAKYNGKRVAVVGYYHAETETSNFSPRRYDDLLQAFPNSLWLGNPSTSADRSAIHIKSDSWLRVEGTVDTRSHGHMDCWPGELVRITKAAELAKGNHKPHA